MRKIRLNGREYPVEITLGVMEDLERRGHSLNEIGSSDSFSVSLIMDILEIAAGVDRDELRSAPLSALAELAAPVSDALNDSFSTGDDPDVPGEV